MKKEQQEAIEWMAKKIVETLNMSIEANVEFNAMDESILVSFSVYFSDLLEAHHDFRAKELVQMANTAMVAVNEYPPVREIPVISADKETLDAYMSCENFAVKEEIVNIKNYDEYSPFDACLY